MPTPQVPAYASPATSGYLRRSARLSDAIQQLQGSRTQDSWRTGTASWANVLADALNSWNLDQQEARGEAGLKADRAKLSDALLSQFPGSRDIMKADLNSSNPVDLTPRGYTDRDQRAQLGDSVRSIAELTGDPLAALQYGQSQQQQALMNKLALQKANAPIEVSNGASLVDPITRQQIYSDPGNSTAPSLQQYRGENGNWWTFNPKTSERTDSGQKAPPPTSGVTINMPGNVREGVDENGNTVFVGIDPKDPNGGYKTIPGATPPQSLMGGDTKSKFLAMAPNALNALGTLRQLFGKEGDNPLSGNDDVAAQVFSSVPLVGDIAARAIGGQNWQDFDQAWNTIELGVHIPAGANVSPSEATRFLRANKPALGDTDTTIATKLDNIQRFYDGLAAGFKGDLTALKGLLQPSGKSAAPPAAGAAPVQIQLPAGVPPLDAEEQAIVQQMRAAGMSEADIMATINGQ